MALIIDNEGLFEVTKSLLVSHRDLFELGICERHGAVLNKGRGDPMRRSMDRETLLQAIKESALLIANIRAVSVTRELFRYISKQNAPRFVCEQCRFGFRFESQLAKHSGSKQCVPKPMPVKVEGTIIFNMAKTLVEHEEFARLREEILSRQKVSQTRLSYPTLSALLRVDMKAVSVESSSKGFVG